MGTGDNAPLSEDAVPARRHADRSARRAEHAGEAGQEQTETHHAGAGREAGQGAEGGQIRRVLGADAERTQERVRRGDPSRTGTPRASQKAEVQVSVNHHPYCYNRVFFVCHRHHHNHTYINLPLETHTYKHTDFRPFCSICFRFFMRLEVNSARKTL